STSMSNVATGTITQTIKNLQNQSQGLNTQIQFYANIAAEEQKMLTNQFAQLQTTLGTLQNQSQSLGSALAGLSAG
ncbi:MAG: hypothetical protein M0013_00265, partial [Actinomycetota bacterium]|nr:hypothetical protein [Actinomycetota bacterium]